MTVASSKYIIINGYLYLSKDETRETSVLLGELVTLKLVSPYVGYRRNVTNNNSFTNLPLVKKTTVVGTI